MRNAPFEGEVPTVGAGVEVECRNTCGDWVAMVATGSARYDRANAAGHVCYLTVPVATRAEWRAHGDSAHTVNWPAEAVRVATAEEAPCPE